MPKAKFYAKRLLAKRSDNLIIILKKFSYFNKTAFTDISVGVLSYKM
jgi:hypothetical protein